MTRVLTDPYKNKLVNKDVVPVQKKTTKYLKASLKNNDQQAKNLTGDELTNFLTQYNQQNADYAQNVFQKLNNKLIVDSTRQTKIVQDKNL